ncbi:Gp138 family membrane-puncturing spike protein [Paenibacillus pini]|uniref:Phage protein Gp138 N-terminal domain-containing protein n=1 Tax=Paenibacillus pini JCM 16418 TaxID=1236976 RepID=W7YEA9_9BACL|nr:Gp138 family membrane-puncturing spike protein [Paenibacillus pini]GAF06827.1 hypothetical protein JCM16418_809 [Paenibacillus pini JCM 16418]
MRTDPAGGLSQLLSSFQDKLLSSLHVGFPCKVIKFDESKLTADVQPLIRTTSGDPAMLQGVPVLGQQWKIDGGTAQVYKPVLRQGDVVFVVCADQEIKNALNGSIASADTGRQHDPNDAVIVGVFGCSLSS